MTALCSIAAAGGSHSPGLKKQKPKSVAGESGVSNAQVLLVTNKIWRKKA